MKKDIRIVVLPAGWVFVGEWSENGSEVILDNASCIRVWGTTHGVGELAIKGPLKETVLDKCGLVKFIRGTEVVSLVCQTKW